METMTLRDQLLSWKDFQSKYENKRPRPRGFQGVLDRSRIRAPGSTQVLNAGHLLVDILTDFCYRHRPGQGLRNSRQASLDCGGTLRSLHNVAVPNA